MRKACLLVPVVMALLFAAPVSGQTWIEGEMGYRVSAIPDGSPAARSGLKIGDVLAEPAPLPQRLRDAGPGGVEIPVYRFDVRSARYTKGALKVVFQGDEDKRLGTTGDLGFIVTGTKPRSLGERAELRAGDFITKIGKGEGAPGVTEDTFVHSVDDLKLVDQANEKNEQVLIQFIRWLPESSEFKTLVSRRRFVK